MRLEKKGQKLGLKTNELLKKKNGKKNKQINSNPIVYREFLNIQFKRAYMFFFFTGKSP